MLKLKLCSEEENSFRFKWIIILLILFMSRLSFSQNVANDPSYETFNLSINFEKIGTNNFQVIYKEPSQLFLPVADIFDYLKIYRIVSPDGQTISGYMQLEKNAYSINYKDKLITYQGNIHTIKPDDFIFDTGILYVDKNVLENVFSFKIKFDFRSLSADFGADYELPLARLMKIEKARENLKKRQDIIAYDSVWPRKYHLLKFGMIDWSIASNQSQTYTNETRMGLAGGAEILGGETNVWLNYSDKYGFDKNQQRYYWRWVDNNAFLAKQIQVGRVYNRSVATLLYPINGVSITNAPTTVRKALGDYQLSDHTNPDWVVELYINNVLMDYTRADASGFYSFKVPIVYGTSNVSLHFFGPNGEERSEEKTFNMPYNMLPKGEFEYKATGGYMLDSLGSRYGRVEANLGITSWLTLGAGAEYLSSILVNPEIPFLNFTFQPIPKLVITGEYAYKVRTKATLNYSLFNSSMLELDYSKYAEGQKAIIYNFLGERMASLSIPVSLYKVSGYIRSAFRQNIYPNFKYNSGEFMLSAYTGNFNANLSNFFNWTDTDTPNMYGNLALGLKIGKGTTIRPSAQYNYSTKSLLSCKAELEQQVFKRGYFTMGYENNFSSAYNSFNISFRYDFSFMSTYFSTYFNNKQIQTSQSARGSFAFGSGNKYVYADSHEAVGRCGISIEPFIDVNFNGIRDKGEPRLGKISVRCNGGRILYNEKDSVVRIVGLEPFVEYNVTLDESSVDNIAWRLKQHSLKVCTDPNQFKRIKIVVEPMGEVHGMVIDSDDKGKGRILISITDDKGKVITKIQTESDGYFSYLGLKPGKYSVSIDSLQLSILKMNSKPVNTIIVEDIMGDSKDVGNLLIFNNVVIPPGNPIKPENSVGKGVNLDSLLQYMIFFDFDKSDIGTEFSGSLVHLAKIINENPCVKLQIQGHTDSDGTNEYNQLLSERRAKSVMSKLMKLGVNPNRLSMVGFGERKPLPGNTNRNALEKSKNRRVVFKNNSDKDCVNIDSLLRLSLNIVNCKIQKDIDKSISITNDEIVNMNTRYLFSVLFDQNKSDIRSGNYIFLNSLIKVIQQHQCIQLKILAYTDSEGDIDFNQKLSERRANSISNYLISKGIPKNRMQSICFGETQPLNQNKNESEKAVNRRVLFKASESGCNLSIDSLIYNQMPQTFNGISKEMFVKNIDDKFMIQVGALGSKPLALILAERLRSIFPENIYLVEEDNFFKVRIGYMNTRKEALKMASIIQTSEILKIKY
jgi:outer membrane protein OmpA-like peptidoglycan-associated protein